jgi:hypothetical protein
MFKMPTMPSSGSLELTKYEMTYEELSVKIFLTDKNPNFIQLNFINTDPEKENEYASFIPRPINLDARNSEEVINYVLSYVDLPAIAERARLVHASF